MASFPTRTLSPTTASLQPKRTTPPHHFRRPIESQRSERGPPQTISVRFIPRSHTCPVSDTLSVTVAASDDAKKSRLATTDRLAAPTETALLCTGHSLTPACVNNAAAKCSHAACSACCPILGAGGDATGCEFHEAKAQAHKERMAAKRATSKAKKVARKGEAVGRAGTEEGA